MVALEVHTPLTDIHVDITIYIASLFRSSLQIQTQHSNTVQNTTSIVLVIVQSSSSSDKAVCSVRHEAMQEDKTSTDSQLREFMMFIFITAVLQYRLIFGCYISQQHIISGAQCY